ncbi:MAG: efflux RND transporter permease subunit [Ignavibacteriaceae bacterium]|nr:efflux RND transporter permease subunit [Ignavibacteriaceae bacterium]
MKKIIYTFLTRPVTALMVFFSVFVIGAVSFFNIPIELLPHTEYPRLSVSASWNGVSPEAVEAYLTSPLEAVLASVKGVKKISSRSSEGNTYIDLEFHSNTNIEFARLEINEKLGAIIEELPYGISVPRLSLYVPKEFRDLQGFLTYTLTADLSANEIRKYAIDYLKTSLLSINGVSDVVVKGGNEREILITIDYEKAKSLFITNKDISDGLNNAEQIVSAGTIRKKDSQLLVKINNEINSVEVLLNQPIKTIGTTVVRLKDIGTVTDDFSEQKSFFRINGREAVFLEISKEQGQNTIKVADDVYKKLEELKANFPPGFNLVKEIDMSLNVRDEINELFKNAGYSLIIILLVLAVFFRRIIYSLIIISSIIFSLLSAFIFFYIFNLPLNILTIASLILGFGLMVDNSIVVIDYLDKHVVIEDLKRLSVHTKNIFFPVFASTLTTIAVFIPLVFLTGELKLYFEQFALAIVITLSSSLVISFSIVPMFFAKLISKHNSQKKDNFWRLKERKLQSFFRDVSKPRNRLSQYIFSFILQLILKWKKTSVVFLILIIGLPVWLLPARIEIPIISTPYNAIFDSEFFGGSKKYFNYALGGSLNLFFNHIQKGEVFAYGDTDYLIVRLRLPNGNRIERINNLTQDFEKEVLAYRQNIENITANVFDEENSIVRIDFSPEQTGSSFPYILKNYLTAYAVRLGGLEVSVYGYGPGFYSGGGNSSSSFIVEIAGFNFTKLKGLAKEFKELVSSNPRVDNIDIDRSYYNFNNDETYEISAEVNREILARNNISVTALFDEIANSTRGNLGYNKFRIGREEVFYSVKYSNYKNIQQEELENLIFHSSGKDYLKIKDVITFKESKVLSTINRENQQYIRNISFDYKGPYQYGNEFVESSISRLELPAGYSIKKREFSFLFGKDEEIEAWTILAISLLLIFMITSGLFESIKKPFLIILAVPFALIGTIILFYFGDFNLDRGAYAGLLLLIGLSVNNSIILVDYLSKNYSGTGFNEIIKLSYNRVRPIFTTTFTTIAAMIPLILNIEQSFWKSLSLSVMGGLLFSAIFIVVFIPVFYWLMNKTKYIYSKTK